MVAGRHAFPITLCDENGRFDGMVGFGAQGKVAEHYLFDKALGEKKRNGVYNCIFEVIG